MNDRSVLPSRITVPGLIVLVAATACLGAIASPALAGIGNPLKKIKKEVEKAVTPQAQARVADEPIVFDDVTLELTEERVGRILKALQASKAASASRAAVVAKLDKTSEERGKLWEKHGEKIMELQRKRDEIEVCRHDGYREAQDRLSAEYSQKALTDPAIREKFAKAAQEYNAAAAKGDSAATAKLHAVLYSETLISSEDSAAVREKCGPMPPPIPPEGRIAALDKEMAAQNEQLRNIDKGVADEQASALQMDREQYGMAMDRVEAYMGWRKAAESGSGSPPVLRGLTPAEIEVLDKHYKELLAALAG